jgi:putative hydrolase of the HAD superfamily
MRAHTAQPFYLIRDLFRETFRRTYETFGVPLSEAQTAAMYSYFMERLGDASPQLVDGARETLAALRDRGLVTGIVSNSDEEHLLPALRAAWLEGAVDFALSSEAAGSCKPHPEIFREALRRAGCAAEEALFVGDQPEQDIAGANRAGLRTVLHTGPGAALTGHIERAGLAGDARPQSTITRLPDVLALLDDWSRQTSPGEQAAARNVR